MAEIVEQRVKTTVIRRRAKLDATPPQAQPVAEEKVAAEPVKAAAPAPAAIVSAPAVLQAPKVAAPIQHVPAPAQTRTPAPAQVTVRASASAQASASGSYRAQSFTPQPFRGVAPVVAGSGMQKLTIISQPKLSEKATVRTQRPGESMTGPGQRAATTLQALEDKFKKAPKKKLSKAEMELEEIKRAGGLKHYVVDETAPLEIPTIVPKDRVFQPGPRRRKPVKREFQKTAITEPRASKKVIKISEAITISELSQNMGIKASEIIAKLMALGMMVTVNQAIDVDTAEIICKDYGYEIEKVAFKEEDILKTVKKERGKGSHSRPPVVTIMGHVDHGKTSVLDYIRKAKVAAGEAGGITQHVGAYEVVVPKGKITFIDTPGHAAFTAMRARGAKVTDIVILVVAADDGVMPQTKEAIDHSRAAGVPIIVAINKIDKPEANAERTKRSLSEYGVLPEDWGGDVICVPTSAKSGQGIDQLLDMVLLQAEVMELKADKDCPAKGTIIEARMDRGFGPVASVLVQEGTLKVGAAAVCGLHYGKVRALINSLGQNVEQAGPSEAVSIIGLSGVPMAGDELVEAADEKDARTVSETRQQKQRLESLAKSSRVTLEDLHKQVAEGSLEELGIVLKADVHGSVEAIKEALVKLSTEKVKVKILHAGVGGITESDVLLAAAGGGIIIGFNVVPEAGVTAVAEKEGVEIRRYSIIYDVMDEVKKSMEGLLAPLQVEKITGHAEVRQVFSISKIGTIAGCSVKDGKVPRNAGVRLLRDSVIVFTGKISSLKRFKDDAKEVSEGNECGISIERYNDIKVGDIIEAFIIEQIAQKL